MYGAQAPQARLTMEGTATRLPPPLALTGTATLAPLLFQAPAACIISPVTPETEDEEELATAEGPGRAHGWPARALTEEMAPTTLRTPAGGGTVDALPSLGRALGPSNDHGKPHDYWHNRPTGRPLGRQALEDGCYGPGIQGGRIGGPFTGSSGGVALGGGSGTALDGNGIVGYNYDRLRRDGGHPLVDGISLGSRGGAGTTGHPYTGSGDGWYGDNSHRGDDVHGYHPDESDNRYDEKCLDRRNNRLPYDGANTDGHTHQEDNHGNRRRRDMVDSMTKPPHTFPRSEYGALEGRPPAYGGLEAYGEHANARQPHGGDGRAGQYAVAAGPPPWHATTTVPSDHDHKTSDGYPPSTAGGHARSFYRERADAADGGASPPPTRPSLAWQRPPAGAAASGRLAPHRRDDAAAVTATARPHMTLGFLPLAVHDTAPVGATLPPRPRPPPLVRPPYGDAAAAAAAFGTPHRHPAGGLLPLPIPAASAAGAAEPWAGGGLGDGAHASGTYPPGLAGKGGGPFGLPGGPLPSLPPLRGSPWVGQGASGSDSGSGGSGSGSGAGGGNSSRSGRSGGGGRVCRPHSPTTLRGGGGRALPHGIDKQPHRRGPGGRPTPAPPPGGNGSGSGGDSASGGGGRQAKTTGVTCGQCGNGFVKKSNLARHIRTVHDGLRPFMCAEPGCGIRFAHKTHLVRHGKTHLPKVPYTCTVPGCREGFRKHLPLLEHQMAVHGRAGSSRAGAAAGGVGTPPAAATATMTAAAAAAAAQETAAAAAVAAVAAAPTDAARRATMVLATRQRGTSGGIPPRLDGRTLHGTNDGGRNVPGNDNGDSGRGGRGRGGVGGNEDGDGDGRGGRWQPPPPGPHGSRNGRGSRSGPPPDSGGGGGGSAPRWPRQP